MYVSTVADGKLAVLAQPDETDAQKYAQANLIRMRKASALGWKQLTMISTEEDTLATNAETNSSNSTASISIAQKQISARRDIEGSHCSVPVY